MKYVILVILILVLMLLTAGYWLFYYAVCRFVREPKSRIPSYLEPYREMMEEGEIWFQTQNPELIELPAYDGERLAGLYLEAEDARGTVMLVHGYRSSPHHDFGSVFRFYYSMGYSILAIYQRAHGESGGDFISLGIKERFDVRDWARYLCDRFGLEHDVYLSGISMGCSTVLMASSTELPENVRGIIADCGYTSPWEELRFVFQKRRIPVHPFLDLVDIYARLLGGFSLRDYSTLDALRFNTLPVLFVHGEDDQFVPLRFTQDNYEACRGEKTLVTVPGAGHGASWLVAQIDCQHALAMFLQKHSTYHPGRDEDADMKIHGM